MLFGARRVGDDGFSFGASTADRCAEKKDDGNRDLCYCRFFHCLIRNLLYNIQSLVLYQICQKRKKLKQLPLSFQVVDI